MKTCECCGQPVQTLQWSAAAVRKAVVTPEQRQIVQQWLIEREPCGDD